jgi:hypothetical protein
MGRFLALISVLVLTGCQTTADSATPIGAAPAAGMAAITITRSNDLMYVGAPASISVNGEKVADLGVGQSYSGSVRPGSVIVSASAWSAPGQSSTRFQAEAGKTYRLQVMPRAVHTTSGAIGGLAGQAVEGGGPFQVVAQ